jgi:hypothetical protein
MRRGRMMVVTVACAVAAAVGAPGALGATPQQIYKDYADNGRLDQHYSSADLKRALKDAVVQGYPKQTSGAGLAPTIKKKLSSGVAASPKSLPAAKHARGALPFTGVDLALMVTGGLGLLLLGAGLRKVARTKA